MRYVGGKGRIAKKLIVAMKEYTDSDTVYDLFMGGGAMTAAFAENFQKTISGDGHEDVALMWQAVLNGWIPPAVSYERYQELRYSDEPSAERGFVGYGCSFGGRWFEGYARGGNKADGTPRNHQEESVRAVLKDRDKMLSGDVSVSHKSYDEWVFPTDKRLAIYCDPPYATSQSKKRYAVSFDIEKFWEWAEELSKSHDVFVSEYEAPDGWESVIDLEKRQSLVVGSGNRGMRTEKLFMFSNSLNV